MPTLKTQRQKRTFFPGPPLADSAGLLAWLESNPGTTLRLPVVIISSSESLGGNDLAFIGTDLGPPAEDAVLLDLDDSTLGIPLSTRLRSLCDAETCVVWIEGIWGRALPDLEDQQPPPWPFTVRDTGPRVEGSPQTIFVER